MLCLNSCCWREGDLITAYRFTEEEKTLIPYQNDQTIPFRHSNGFEFEAYTNKDFFTLSTQEECNQNYDTFESIVVNLMSEIPNLEIEIKLLKSSFSDEPLLSIKSGFNNIFFETDPAGLTSIEIDGVVYENLRTFSIENEDYYISNLLYNSTSGIVRINYKDQTHVEIIP